MKINTIYQPLFVTVFFLLTFNNLSAQVTIDQNKMFHDLLQEKRIQNHTLNFKNTFKIQIYSGDVETAKKTIHSFKQNFDDLDHSIEFSAPIYKVWVGNFVNKIDAERNLQRVQSLYPKALIVKPIR